MAARERGRPPRQVGPPVLLRPRLREPPAVIESVRRFGHTCKTQAARRARAEALAGGVGAVLTHNLLQFETRGPVASGRRPPRRSTRRASASRVERPDPRRRRASTSFQIMAAVRILRRLVERGRTSRSLWFYFTKRTRAAASVSRDTSPRGARASLSHVPRRNGQVYSKCPGRRQDGVVRIAGGLVERGGPGRIKVFNGARRAILDRSGLERFFDRSRYTTRAAASVPRSEDLGSRCSHVPPSQSLSSLEVLVGPPVRVVARAFFFVSFRRAPC